MIFVTIGTQHHNKTAILRLCARVMRGQARAQTFNIAYSMLHKISFRMSDRSSLCDVWFSQTLRHKFDLYINLPIFFIKRVIIKSLQCHLKLKNENGTPKPCKLLKGAAHGKMS